MWKLFFNIYTGLILAIGVTGWISTINEYSGPDSTIFSSMGQAISAGDTWAILCMLFSLALLVAIGYRLYKAVTNRDRTGNGILKKH